MSEFQGLERRTEESPEDTGERRRASDREEDFALLRDKALLALGAFIVLGITITSVFTKIHNPEIALAALTVGGGLLGTPTVLRWDENVRRRRAR